MKSESVPARVKRIPIGYSEVLWAGRKYGVTRTDYSNGKSTKIYATELGGSDFVSFNFYFPLGSSNLKPCEMPIQKVADFISNYSIFAPS